MTKEDKINNYFSSLAEWDGVDRFPEFLSQIELETEYHRDFLEYSFIKWFVAMTASLVNNAVANNTCFVLVGQQGTYKTTFIVNLVPKDFRLNIHQGIFDPSDSDHLAMLGEDWLINIDGIGDSEYGVNEMKSLVGLVSKSIIKYRPRYESSSIVRSRKASFASSTNNPRFPVYEFGLSEFLTFHIWDIKPSGFNIDLLYSQALAMYKNGFEYSFNEKDKQLIYNHNNYCSKRLL